MLGNALVTIDSASSALGLSLLLEHHKALALANLGFLKFAEGGECTGGPAGGGAGGSDYTYRHAKELLLAALRVRKEGGCGGTFWLALDAPVREEETLQTVQCVLHSYAATGADDAPDSPGPGEDGIVRHSRSRSHNISEKSTATLIAAAAAANNQSPPHVHELPLLRNTTTASTSNQPSDNLRQSNFNSTAVLHRHSATDAAAELSQCLFAAAPPGSGSGTGRTPLLSPSMGSLSIRLNRDSTVHPLHPRERVLGVPAVREYSTLGDLTCALNAAVGACCEMLGEIGQARALYRDSLLYLQVCILPRYYATMYYCYWYLCCAVNHPSSQLIQG